MKKLRAVLSVIMVSGIIMGAYHVNAYAKVSSYILKDSSSNKLYEYDVKDIQSNINSPLFFEFMNNFKQSNKVLIHDDEAGKYVDYEVVKKSFNNKKVDIDKICKNAIAEKEPFYVYHRINKNGKIENQLNFTKNNMEIDFEIFQLKESNDIRISGNNFGISNLETKNDVIITPDKNGSVTLNNVKANSIRVIGSGESNVKLVNVQADSLQIDGNSKLSIDGKFLEVKVNTNCEMNLSKNTVINKLSALDNVVIKGNSRAKIQKLIGMKNVKNINNINTVKIDSTTSASKHGEDKLLNHEVNKTSNKVNTTEKFDITTSASKHNEEKSSSYTKSKISATISNTQKPDTTTSASKKELSPSSEKNEKETNDTDSTSSNISDSHSITDKKDIFKVIDKERTCIMNIHYVNYGVIVIKKGTCDDYDFYIDGKKVNIQKVNKEGSVVKVELNNKNDKKLIIQKGQQKEEMILKYRNF